MQGEGQEFESPRLHHHSSTVGANRIARVSSPKSIKLPQRDFVPHRAPDPCPPHCGRPRTSGSLGGGTTSVGLPGDALSSASHLNNWICFGRLNESSISPSSQERNDSDRSQSATGRLVRGWRGSSYKGHGVDALAPRADEGRGRLRKAPGSREQTLIRRCPNGETRLGSCPVTPG